MFDIDWQSVLGQLAYDPKNPMIFSTGVFLLLFLGFTLIYNLLGKKTTLRLLFVTAFSYYFYYKSSGFYFYLLFIVTFSDFFLAWLIHRNNQRHGLTTEEAVAKRKLGVNRLLLALSLMVDLGILVYFKYTNFFGNCWANITGGTWDMLDIILPVGVSFFTFQSLSYTFDVYRGKLPALTSFLDYAFFVSFFPQLVAGPIVRACDFAPQISKPVQITSQMFARAVFLIGTGLFKKAVISDYISLNFVDRIFDDPSLYSGVENLLGVYAYTLQIYCDFSGYSDMAIGLALLLGFHFPQNFNAPYISRSVSEFWHRWHISLSTWIRDYIYISLGGNRHGRLRQYFNLIVTMLLGGLWHGASLCFILWGGMHGVALVVNKLWRTHVSSRLSFLTSARWYARPWAWLYSLLSLLLTFHFVCLAWVFFRNPTFASSYTMLSRIMYDLHPELLPQVLHGYRYVFMLVIFGYFTHLLPQSFNNAVIGLLRRGGIVVGAVFIVAVVYIVIQVKSSTIQPFIYFQF